jgi:hypothetical protein
MIFQRDLAEAALAGEKTVTRRLCSDNPRSPWWRERCRYVPGKVFTINPGRGERRIGEARVVACWRQLLGQLSDAEARLEGFADAAEFEAAFAEINGVYDSALWVWHIEFEVLRP